MRVFILQNHDQNQNVDPHAFGGANMCAKQIRAYEAERRRRAYEALRRIFLAFLSKHYRRRHRMLALQPLALPTVILEAIVSMVSD
jgi:hypothetical protein